MDKIKNCITTFFSTIGQEVGVVIGNFDGVHIGHRGMLNHFINECHNKKIKPIVITFKPHPHLYFNENAKYLLSSYAVRSKIIKNIDSSVEIFEFEFNHELQSMSATDFIKKVLLNIPRLKYIYLGHDFALGSGKENSSKILKELCLNITINQSPSLRHKDEIVSSTYIRTLLSSGHFNKAIEFMGGPVVFVDKIQKGKGIGSKELVATINFNYPCSRVEISKGVYASITIIKGKKYNSISNVGVNPTISDDNILKIETHLLDESLNLYNEEVEVQLYKYIREEMKFETLEELKYQINKDIEKVRTFFEKN